jgi:hypothetical protein
VLLAENLALRRADPPPRSRTDCVKDEETEKAAKVQQKAVEPWIDRFTENLKSAVSQISSRTFQTDLTGLKYRLMTKIRIDKLNFFTVKFHT